MSRIKRLFSAITAAFAFQSQLQPLSEAENLALGFINPFPNGRFNFYGRTNGASRKRRSNRLHLSRKTKNKHR